VRDGFTQQFSLQAGKKYCLFCQLPVFASLAFPAPGMLPSGLLSSLLAGDGEQNSREESASKCPHLTSPILSDMKLKPPSPAAFAGFGAQKSARLLQLTGSRWPQPPKRDGCPRCSQAEERKRRTEWAHLGKQTDWILVLKPPLAAAVEENTENTFIQTEKPSQISTACPEG